MSTRQIAIYGAGGFAREVAWLVQACNEGAERYQVVCFIDDDLEKQGRMLNGIPIMSLEHARERFPAARVVSGVGSPQTRQLLMEKAAQVGFEFETVIHPRVERSILRSSEQRQVLPVIHPRVERSPWIEIGVGTVICAGNILTTNIVLGRHVQINLDCTIGHDVVMGDYATLAPGVHVSGCVHLGQRVYVGTGAVIINGTLEEPIQIGDDAVIGAGACVIGSVPASVTVVGVPARPLLRPQS